MSNGALQRYVNRGEVPNESPGQETTEPIDDLGAFGWLRGINSRALMLDFRKQNGNRLAIAYSWISEVAFDPSTGIVIRAGDVRVEIRGRGLATAIKTGVSLYDGLLLHRTSWIRELDAARDFGAGRIQCDVESIRW